MSTLLGFVVLAAEEAEPDKTPFYLAGGALAVFAVVVGVLGLMQPGFSRAQGARNAVMALAAVLVAAAMATSVITG